MEHLYKFSIIIPFYNENTLKKPIESLMKQKIKFEDIQLILIDNSKNDYYEFVEEFLSKYPYNIILIKNENKSYRFAKNLGLKYAKGKYVNICNEYNYFPKNALSKIYQLFEENYNDIDVVSLKRKQVGSINYYHELNNNYNETTVIDLNENPNIPQLNIHSTFIKNEILCDYKFNSSITKSDDALFLNDILLNKLKLGICNERIYERKVYNQNYPLKYNTEELIEYLYNFHNNIIKKSIDKYNTFLPFLQYTLAYDLKKIIENTTNNKLNKEDKEKIFDVITTIAKQIDDNYFINNVYINNEISSFILSFIKKNHEFEIYKNKINPQLDDINEFKIEISDLKIINQVIYLKCNFKSHLNICNINFNIYLKNNRNIISYTPTKLNEKSSGNTQYLSTDWVKNYETLFKIPITENIYNSRLFFEITYGNDVIQPSIEFIFRNNFNSFISPTDELLIFNQLNSLLVLPYTIKETPINYKFSIIMALHNSEKYLSEAVNSIINQSMKFIYNCELIIVNEGSTDNSLNIINEFKKKYPNNIIILNKDQISPANARNLGLNYANGKYVNFLDSDDYISQETLENVFKFFEKNFDKTDLVTIPQFKVDRETDKHRLNYIFSKTRLLNVDKRPNNPLISCASTFFKKNALKNIKFNDKLLYSEDMLFVNEIILKKMRYGIVTTGKYFYRKRFDETALTDYSFNKKEFYINRLDNCYINLINKSKNSKNKIPKYIQNLFAYDLQDLIKISDMNILNKEEQEEFIQKLVLILSYIDDNIITKNRKVEPKLRSFLMYLKNGSYSLCLDNNNAILKTNDMIFDQLKNHKLELDSVKISDGYLNVLGHVRSNFSDKTMNVNLIEITPEGEENIKYNCEFIKYQQDDRQNINYLSIDWIFDYNFDVYIPLNNKNSRYQFEIEINENDVQTFYNPTLSFRTPTGLRYINNFAKDNKLVFFDSTSVFVYNYSYFAKFKFEIKDLIKIFKDKKNGFIYAIFLRVLYMLLYPFMKNKKIWIMNDRPFVADDNAIHLFKYAIKQNDGIDKYYILNNDCDDFKKLKKNYKNIVANGSLKHKILYLFAEKRISAFLNTSFCNPFFLPKTFDYRHFYSNLLKQQVYFLQHGVISRDLSTHMRRYNHNVQLVVTSADAERNSFFEIGYNFKDNVVQALGLPRYDNLTTDETKKEIVFMPTWRSQFEKDETIFFNSGYYQSMKELLNNNELQEKLNEKGYIFKFKPHPELLKFIDSFDIHEKIVLSTEERYQELFRDSCLLITDFSSVIFDFAYLKKPVIYYQPNDDYHYAEAYFDYETMGLGPVIKKEKELINKIIEYVDNNCVMEEKYKNRVSKFFKYNDKNNCKRVYEWIYEN